MKKLAELIKEEIFKQSRSPWGESKFDNQKIQWWNTKAYSDTKQEYENMSKNDPTRAKMWINAKYSEYVLKNNPKQYWAKKDVSDHWREIEKYDRNKAKESLNMNTVKKIFNKFGLKTTVYSSTAIRGYSIPSNNSYQIDKYNVGRINFTGISKEKFNNIVQELQNTGFKIKEKSEPSKAVGQGSASAFTIYK